MLYGQHARARRWRRRPLRRRGAQPQHANDRPHRRPDTAAIEVASGAGQGGTSATTGWPAACAAARVFAYRSVRARSSSSAAPCSSSSMTLDAEQTGVFCSVADDLGVHVKWFGAPAPVGFTSAYPSWRYAQRPACRATDAVLAGCATSASRCPCPSTAATTSWRSSAHAWRPRRRELTTRCRSAAPPTRTGEPADDRRPT